MPTHSLHLRIGIGAVLLIVGATGAACQQPQEAAASLAELAADQDRYEGARVTVEGHVQRFTETDGSRYFVVTDLDANRVLLAPAERAEPFAERTVCVSGRFTVDEEQGRMISIDRIAPAPCRARLPS